MKILVVDDFATVRRIVKNLLRDMGVKNTSEADDGATALPMLKNGNFDFLITDWYMPKMQGMELLLAMKADEKLKNIPVLIITAAPKREQMTKAAHAGVNGFIVKPFTAETLKAKIDRVLTRVGRN